MDIFGKIVGFLEMIFTGLLSIVSIAGAVAFVALLLFLMFTQDPSKKSQIKGHMKTVGIATVSAFLVREIIEAVVGYFLNGGGA